jgi:MFS family permease
MTLGRNYRRLWTGSAFSNLADGVFQVALPLLALRITRSPAQIAGVALAARLPWLLFALHAGALADRLDRRRTMVNVDVARVLLIGTLAAVAAIGGERLWILYLIAFVLGIGETIFDTAAQSVMPMVVERDDLSRANSRLFAAEMTMNRFVGPPVGGLLAGVAMALAFAGSAAGYLIAAAAIALMSGRFRPRRRSLRPSRLRTDIREGLGYLFRHRLLRTLAFMVGVMNLSIMATLAVFPLFAVRPGPMGLSGFGFGLLLAAGAVGSLVGSFAAPHLEKRLGRARTLQIAVVASSGACAAPLLTHPLLVAGAFVLVGIGEMCWDVITVSLRQRLAPEHMLGRVNAGYRLMGYGTMPVGAALGGVLGEALGLRWVFGIGAVANLLLLLCMRLVTDEEMQAADSAAHDVPPSLGND